MGSKPFERLGDVLRAYQIESPVTGASLMGGGHIHHTWSVTTDDARGYVLQELNERVFRDLAACEDNLRRIDDHFHLADHRHGITIPKHLRTETNGLHVSLHDGSTWRATHHVDHSVAPSKVNGADDAWALARAFGLFASALRSLPGRSLRATIPQFHDFTWRVEQLRDARLANRTGRTNSVRRELSAADALADRLLRPARAIADNAAHSVHNDAKVTNLLCHHTSGAALAVVDLDTTMPGSALVDLGELIRSGASDRPEDARDVGTLDIRRPVIVALIEGFRDAYDFTDVEAALIHYAGPVLAVENGMRFLADHLNGDVYFRVDRPQQNLDRARVQFRLATELLA